MGMRIATGRGAGDELRLEIDDATMGKLVDALALGGTRTNALVLEAAGSRTAAAPIAPAVVREAIERMDAAARTRLRRAVDHAIDTGREVRMGASGLTTGPGRIDEPTLEWPTWHAISTLRGIGLPVGLEPELIRADRVLAACGRAAAGDLGQLAELARYALDSSGPDARISFG